jgi:hypothetical protein
MVDSNKEGNGDSPIESSPAKKVKHQHWQTDLERLLSNLSLSVYKKQRMACRTIMPGPTTADRLLRPPLDDGNTTDIEDDHMDDEEEEPPTEAAKGITPLNFSKKQFEIQPQEMYEFFGNIDDEVEGTIDDDNDDSAVSISDNTVQKDNKYDAWYTVPPECNADLVDNTDGSGNDYNPDSDSDVGSDDDSFFALLGEDGNDDAVLICKDDFLPQYYFIMYKSEAKPRCVRGRFT